jgi:hypothetical protein
MKPTLFMALFAFPVWATPPSFPFPSGKVETVNIVQWQANDLPKIYERSSQLPLTDAEVLSLVQAEFSPETIVKMIEERRCACDASAEGLIRLKKAKVPEEVLKALSLHALKPNRELHFLVNLEFTGNSREARKSYLYFFIEDGEFTRVFRADIHELLSKRFLHEEETDKSDLLIAKKVRRVRLGGTVPLKTYGKRQVLVVSSANPSLSHPEQLTEKERKEAATYEFEYPRTSLQSVCQLTIAYKQDAMLATHWRFMNSRFQCEWN